MAGRLYTDDHREVPAVKRYMSFGEARDAMWRAYKVVFGEEIKTPALSVLLAHSALETGHWKVGIWNWNFGNVKASASYPGKHQYFRCNELINGKYVWYDPPHPQCRFRAYDSPAEGLEHHLRFLGTSTNPWGKPNRYQAAWDQAMAGNPAEFVTELRRARYFTAYLEPYKRTVVQLTEKFSRELQGYTGPTLHPTTGHNPTADLPNDDSETADTEPPDTEIEPGDNLFERMTTLHVDAHVDDVRRVLAALSEAAGDAK